MIKVICDKCGNDCDRNGYEIRVTPVHNPTPLYALDVGELKITDETKSFRFILCQHCYRAMGFPNYYKVTENNHLVFRCEEEIEKGDSSNEKNVSIGVIDARNHTYWV